MRATTLLLLSLSLLAASSEATTYIVPRDAELVARADAIVVATAMSSRAIAAAGGGIRTVFELQVTDVVKGPFAPGSAVAIVEEGGALAGRFALVVGSPRYVEGQEYLVFLEANAAGEYRTWGLGLGQFAFKADASGQRYLTRTAGICGLDTNLEPHIEWDRKAEEFVSYVRTIARGGVPTRSDYLYLRTRLTPQSDALQASAFSRNSYLIQSGGGGYRWRSPQFGYLVANATAAEEAVAQDAVATWRGAGGSDIALSATPATGAEDALPGSDGGEGDGRNVLRFSTAPSNGRAAWAQNYANFQYSEGGETFVDTIQTDISVGPGNACAEIVAHEVGHSLGFRHSDTPEVSGPSELTNDALMRTVVSCSNSSLRGWDVNAAATVYGSGPVCTPPSIAQNPQSVTITEGQSTTLSVTAAGSSPTYQWYAGPAGNASQSQQVPGGTAASVTVSPSVTTSYWVRVTACSTSIDSSAATVTVNPAVCVPPSIVSHPQSPTISTGESAVLSVSASGSAPLTYQWYRGSTGDVSSPMGSATSSSLMVNPTANTSYWVRVTGQCAPAADSQAALVTVVPCATVSVSTPSVAALGGNSYLLSVTASGGAIASVEWFIGGNPGVGGTPAGNGNNFVVAPSAATSYWARVTNSCGNSGVSPAVVVEPAAVCTPPSIASVTASPTSVNSGDAVTLTVVASGSSLQYQWYQGAAGVTTSPITNSNAPSITVRPTASSTYWVSVGSGCGANSANSSAVTVSVATCARPAITTQPIGPTIKGGERATLTVVASGTSPLTYAWYQGEAGDVSKPVGSSATLTTDRLLLSARFWVRVTNACGSVDSNAVTVSIIPARVRAVRR